MPDAQIPPADPDGHNDDRADWALVVVKAFSTREKTAGLDGSIIRLLTGLAHACDRKGLNLHELLRRASVQYNDDTATDGTQFDFFFAHDLKTAFDPMQEG